ncbi:MAG: hypothetical protein CMO80_09865 [Verrucomicrobiales bacterium]|nr:hypothetical protein [Verrucomicrobiales bacterium]|tara:strand:+ start:726 stop:1079 length:354 start_codon:yes stop_codon:yes gene_type:complete
MAFRKILDYAPPPGFRGQGLISVTAFDHLGQSATGTVTVKVGITLRFGISPSQLRFTPSGFEIPVEEAASSNPVVFFSSTNLSEWTPIFTNDSTSDRYLDTSALAGPRRYYRATQVP